VYFHFVYWIVVQNRISEKESLYKKYNNYSVLLLSSSCKYIIKPINIRRIPRYWDEEMGLFKINFWVW